MTLKQVVRKYRWQPDELMAALAALPVGELVSGIVRLIVAGELRLHPHKRRKPKNLCARGYAYDRANPWVPDWFLNAAREKRDEGRTHYSIGNLLEKLSHDVAHGVVKVDEFRISNDLQSYYVRQVLMRDPSLCSLFELKRTSDADALVVNGRTWTDFAKEHEAELWPKKDESEESASLFEDDEEAA